jgi:F-type H+-transporting ATPase subunit b
VEAIIAILDPVLVILKQLGLNESFWSLFVLFFVTYQLLGNLYFKPFLKLFEQRHKKTVEDRQSAEKLTHQAEAKFEEYRVRMAEERSASKRELETAVEQARKEESTLLSQARDEAKRVTQEAAENVARQRDQLVKQLELDVEILARTISEKLIARKV